MNEDNVFQEIMETCKSEDCFGTIRDLQGYHTERDILGFFYRHSGPGHNRYCPCWRDYGGHIRDHHPELWAYILLAMRPSGY